MSGDEAALCDVADGQSEKRAARCSENTEKNGILESLARLREFEEYEADIVQCQSVEGQWVRRRGVRTIAVFINAA